MSARIWDGATWVDAAGINVWNGSAWVPAISGRIWYGGAWVSFLGPDGTPLLNDHTLVASHTVYNGGSASASCQLTVPGSSLTGFVNTGWSPSDTGSEGILNIDGVSSPWSNTDLGSRYTDNFPGEWLQGGDSNLWSVRATITSGGVPSSTKTRIGNFGVWQLCSSSPSWRIISSATSSAPVVLFGMVFTLEFALTSDLSNVVLSATMTMDAEARSTNTPPP
jgi:hypothetical protein